MKSNCDLKGASRLPIPSLLQVRSPLLPFLSTCNMIRSYRSFGILKLLMINIWNYEEEKFIITRV